MGGLSGSHRKREWSGTRKSIGKTISPRRRNSPANRNSTGKKNSPVRRYTPGRGNSSGGGVAPDRRSPGRRVSPGRRTSAGRWSSAAGRFGVLKAMAGDLLPPWGDAGYFDAHDDYWGNNKIPERGS